MGGLIRLLSGWHGSVAMLLISAALAGSAVWKFQTMRYQGQVARLQAALAAEQHKLTRLQLEGRQKIIEQERQQATQLAAIDRRYQQELEDEKAKSLRRLAEWRAAHRKLYIGVQPARCDTRLPASAAASRSDHDGTRAELSTASAQFLVGLAAEADQVVRQLTACQQIVQVDRAVQASRR